MAWPGWRRSAAGWRAEVSGLASRRAALCSSLDDYRLQRGSVLRNRLANC
jgi:hypothetical protein